MARSHGRAFPAAFLLSWLFAGGSPLPPSRGAVSDGPWTAALFSAHALAGRALSIPDQQKPYGFAPFVDGPDGPLAVEVSQEIRHDLGVPSLVIRGGQAGAVLSDVEPVALTDPNTRLPIKTSVPRAQVHGEGLWHQTVHIYVVTPDGRVVLQRRSRMLKTSPGKLQVSVSGHVDFADVAGVDRLDDPAWAYAAASREGEEELGIRLDRRRLLLINDEINAIRRDEPANREFTSVFFYRANEDEIERIARRYDRNEVEELVIIPLDQLPAVVGAHPEAFSGSIRHLIQNAPSIYAALMQRSAAPPGFSGPADPPRSVWQSRAARSG